MFQVLDNLNQFAFNTWWQWYLQPGHPGGLGWGGVLHCSGALPRDSPREAHEEEAWKLVRLDLVLWWGSRGQNMHAHPPWQNICQQLSPSSLSLLMHGKLPFILSTNSSKTLGSLIKCINMLCQIWLLLSPRRIINMHATWAKNWVFYFCPSFLIWNSGSR